MDNPVVLITGASRGIGRAIALKFASEGFACILAARNREKLEETASLIRNQYGSPTLIVPTNLRRDADIDNLASTALAQWGKVDVLVNNAGVLYLKPFLELSIEEFDEMMQVNMRAIFLLTQKILPSMIERKQGTIINIASLAGKNGFKNGTGYGASKWALRGWAASLMMEVREHNIRVVTIFPGSVDTDMAGQLPTAPRRESMIQPEDIARAAYLAYALPERTMLSEIDVRPTNPQKP
ncbi:MAG: SDR family oxidoreductase [Calditrichaeota bacterium]|nr:MAG: SDR family oxidoreductase [Calditrichota bacterium]